MDNYRDENRTDQKEQEVLLVKENPQPARYSASDEDKKKRSFGWFRPLLGGVIGGRARPRHLYIYAAWRPSDSRYFQYGSRSGNVIGNRQADIF